jgi:glycosyltransferase involved in cell wall biosynthesis
LSAAVRVDIVDPSAFTPPYDDALCRALAAAGAQVELHTSRFAHGALAPPRGYARHETFYRLAARARGARSRRALKLAGHVPGMLRYRRAARAADVVHFQWLPVQQLDAHLLPRRGRAVGVRRPALVLTAHDVLPREPLPGQLRGQRRLYDRFDAIVVHSEHGRARLTGELGVPDARVHVIPHGVLRPWEGAPPAPLPGELGEPDGPLALFFGLLRPYKGLDVLLAAWQGIERGELWIVGMPRMRVEHLRESAGARVRWLPRFVSDGEMHALLLRADVVVLPYREIDQSGVAFSALGADRPLLLSDVGGFPELAATGAARTFPSGDVAALRDALRALLDDPAARSEMAARARAAAAGELSWSAIAARTLALYRQLLGR